jgi:hypothetical protein
MMKGNEKGVMSVSFSGSYTKYVLFLVLGVCVRLICGLCIVCLFSNCKVRLVRSVISVESVSVSVSESFVYCSRWGVM